MPSCRHLLPLLMLAAACREALPPEPRPLEVSPSKVVEGTSVELTIRGDHLTARAFTDFSQRGNSQLATSYSARLGNVSLRQVHLVEPGVVKATVPEGIPPGTYDLVVVDPWQREGVLPGAVRVVSPDALDELVAGYRFEPIGPQYVFTPFPVTIVAVDAEGNDVTLFNEAVNLDDETHSVVPKIAGFFAFGRWSGEVDVRLPHEANVLTVTDRFGKTGRSNPFRVATRTPVSLRFFTPERTAAAGECAGPVTLQLLDAIGAETLAPSKLDLSVLPSPSTGFTLHADAACAEALAAPSIPKAESSTTFYFRGVRAGVFRLDAAAPDVQGVSQLQTVLPGAPARLSFSSAAQAIEAGTCSGALAVEIQDRFGNPVPYGAPLDVALSANPSTGFGFFADPACAGAIASTPVGSNTSAATVYFRGTAAGMVEVTASAAPLDPATQLELIRPDAPDRLEFATPPQTRVAGTCSSAVRLEARDPFGNRSPVAADTTLTLSAAPAAGLTFHADAACGTPLGTLILSAGADQATFFFDGTAFGSYTVTASAAGLSPSSQVEQIVPPPPDRIAFVTAPQTLIAGACSAAVDLESRDGTGTPRAVSSATPIELTAPSGSGVTFFADAACGSPVSSVSLPPGSSTARFYFRATVSGNPVLAASVTGWTGDSQTATIDPDVADQLGFGTPARTARAGECSAAVVVQIQDRFGNPSPAPALTPVNLSAAPSSGFTLYSDSGCTTEITSTSIGVGATSVDLYFQGTRAAEITLEVSASGYGSASQSETIQAQQPVVLVFTTPPRTVTAGSCSAALTVQSQDAYGNPAVVASASPIGLSASPSSQFGFYSDGSCAVPITSAQFQPGSDTRSFYVRGTAAGPVNVTASAFASSATQGQTVTPAATAKLTWDAVPSPRPRDVPFAVTLHARDVYDNLTPSFTGSASLSITPSGTVTCARSCAAPATTGAFGGGVWRGEVSLGSAGSGFKLVATAGSVTGTSNGFDVAPLPSRSPPRAVLQAVPAAIVAGGAVLLDASPSSDHQTAAADLEVSFDPTGTAAGGPPWSAWATGKTASATYSTPGTYRPRLAVRDADGDVAYASAMVVVVAAASDLCTVSTTSQLDDGAASCAGPFGADGALSLPEAIRLANASGGKAITFAAAMSLSGPATIALAQPTDLLGGGAVELPASLQVTATVRVAGLDLVGSTTPSVVQSSGDLTLTGVTFRHAAGLVVQGSAELEQVAMLGCTTDCLTDQSGSGLSLRFSELSGGSGVNGLVLESCGAGAPAVEVQTTTFARLRTGIRASCDRALTIKHVTFDANQRGVEYAGGAGHVLENSVFTGQAVQAVACGTAGFAQRRSHLLFQNASAGCIDGDPGTVSADPLYVYAPAGDYRLEASSPAIDSAVDLGLDVNGPAPGNAFGAGPDRGARESN